MAGNDEMLRDHQQMWHTFIKLITYGIIACIVILGGLALTFV